MGDKSIFSQKMHGQICNVCGGMLGFCQNGVLVCSECAFLVCRTCYEFICEAGNRSCPKCFTSYGGHGAEGLSASSSGDQISKQSWESDFKSIHHLKFSRKQAANELLCSKDSQNKQSDGSYNHSRMFSTPLDVLARSNLKDGRVCAEPPARPLSKRAASFPPPTFPCGKKNCLLSFSVPCSPVIGTAANVPVQAAQAKYPNISWVLSSCSLRERLLQWKLEQEKTYKRNESTKELLDMDAFGSFKGLEYENSKVPWVLSSRSLRERLLQWKLLREKISKRSKSKKESLEIDAFGSFKGLEYEKSEVPWLLSSKSLRERLLRWKRAREKNSCSSTKMESCEVNGYGSFEKVELDRSVMDNERRQPLSRKVWIHSSKMNPYRVIIIFRLLIMTFFFRYRLVYPVRNAYGLWLATVLCELWFSLSWLLEQLPKWQPVNRETYPARLCLRYNPPGKENELSCIDVFISTVDPVKEQPIVTANTVLSVLSVDYPVDKVSCYVSDDGASLLIFETLLETCKFARKWVPFCKRFNIEPRSPEHYFSQKVDHLKYSMFPTFPKERRAIKRLYEEFKVLVSDLVFKFKDVPSCGFSMKDGTPWPGNDTQDHPGMIQILVGRRRPHGNDEYELPQLVYVSREKHPSYWHNEKAGAMNALVRVSAVITNGPYILNLDCNHYINNSKAFLEAMCFMMDPSIMDKVCYVQFPQRFDSINPNDQYANDNTVLYDITMKGLDGIQGPLYVGTGCFFNRKALYGYEPKWCGMSWCCPSKKVSNEICSYHSSSHVHSEEGSTLLSMDLERQYPSVVVGLEKYFGQSAFFLSSTLVKDGRLSQSASTDVLLKEAIHVLSCDYEDNTAWGREIGWIYGSLTSDILTGFKMHLRGWRSIYCMPSRPAFRGSAPTNLSDRLSQVLRSAFGSVEILFSKHCPVWYGYGGRLKLLQRIAYINATIYPLTSIPLVTYCTLPAVCLLTGKFIIPPVSILSNVWLPMLFVSVLATGILEIRWGDVSIEEWWRNEQFWAIAGVSSHLFAVFLGMIKTVVGMRIISTVMTKKLHEDKFMERHALKWTALLIVPTALILINLWAMVAGAFMTASSGYGITGLLFAKLFFAFWVILHLYPFLKGLLVRRQQIPYGIIIWPLILAILFSVSWVRFNPFTHRFHGPDLQECGINC